MCCKCSDPESSDRDLVRRPGNQHGGRHSARFAGAQAATAYRADAVAQRPAAGAFPRKPLPSLPKPSKALQPAVQSKGPGGLKPVWQSQEQVEHINKKSSMEQLGQWSDFKTNAVRSPFKFEGLFPAVIFLRAVERDTPAAPVLCTFLALRVLHCDGGAWISGCTCIARTAICAPQDA